MKRKILLVAGGLTMLLGGAVAALFLIDVNAFRPTIQAELQKQLKRPVTLGKLGLSLFPLAIRVDESSVGERAGLPSGRQFIRMQSLEVRTSLSALLRREIQVDSIVLQKPEIEMVKLASGEWNFSDLMKGSGGKGGPVVNLTEVRVADGSIAVTEGSKRSVYQHVNVTLRDLASGQRTTVVASVQVPDSPKEGLKFDGKINPAEGKLSLDDVSLPGLVRATGGAAGPMSGSLSGAIDLTPDSARGRVELKKAALNGKALDLPAALDFDLSIAGDRVDARKLTLTAGKLTANASGSMNTKSSTMDLRARLAETSLAELLSLARLTGASVTGFEGSGVVSLDLTARGSLSAPAIGGQGSLRDAELRTAGLQSPLKVRTTSLTFDRNSARLQNVDASFAGSNMKGWMEARGLSGSTQDLTFDLDVDKLDAAQWQTATTSTSGGGSSSGGSAPSSLRARGNVRIGQLVAQGLVLDRVNTAAALDGGVLRLDPLTAELFGGRESGSIVVDTRPKVPTVELRTKFEGVDANQLLSATTSVKQVLYGLLLAGADAKLSLGATPAEIARSLNGALTMKLTNGKLAGTNVLGQLSTVARFAGYGGASKTATDILLLDGDLKVTDGVARTDNLKMQIEGASLGLAGIVNLVDESVNLKLTAVLDKETSRKVGGTGIGGYLNTALANSQGELVIPALVTGTIDKPKFAPDAAKMAEMKAKQLLPSASNPLGVLSGIQSGKSPGKAILDAISGRAPEPVKQDPSVGTATTEAVLQPARSVEPAPAEQPKQGLRGILDTLRKARPAKSAAPQ